MEGWCLSHLTRGARERCPVKKHWPNAFAAMEKLAAGGSVDDKNGVGRSVYSTLVSRFLSQDDGNDTKSDL